MMYLTGIYRPGPGARGICATTGDGWRFARGFDPIDVRVSRVVHAAR